MNQKPIDLMKVPFIRQTNLIGGLLAGGAFLAWAAPFGANIAFGVDLPVPYAAAAGVDWWHLALASVAVGLSPVVAMLLG